MALFMDGPISSIEELQEHDTQLVQVASVEGIDVSKKLLLAQSEIAVELMAFVRKLSPGWAATGGAFCMNRVVVTPPLKIWHTYLSLEMLYRDAYYSQMNDRYAKRRDDYHEMAQWSRSKVIECGLGMTADPLPRAAAPNLQAAPGSLPNATYYAGMSWANASGEEGGCSLPATITTSGSSMLVQHGERPANATGWHVYLGLDPQLLLRQNSAVLAVGEGWRQPDAVASGKPAGSGQAPGYVQAIVRVIERG